MRILPPHAGHGRRYLGVMNTANEKKSINTSERVFLFHGDDSFSTFQKVGLWRKSFEEKYSASGVTVIDAADDESWLGGFLQSQSSPGLFGGKRLVIIRSVFELPAEESSKIVKSLQDLPEDFFLIFWESRTAKKNLRLFKKLSELEASGAARISEHSLPSGSGLDKFIADYCRNRGQEISGEAVEKLSVFLGRDLREKVKTAAGYKEKQFYDLWQVASELEKLAAYKAGAMIEAGDVEALVSPKFSENVFLLTDAVGSGNSKDTRRYLDQLLGTGGNAGSERKTKALPLVGALAFQFRSLLELSEAKKAAAGDRELAGILGWSPYRVNANSRLLRSFPEGRLQGLLAKLLEADKKIKTTSLPPKILLARALGV